MYIKKVDNKSLDFKFIKDVCEEKPLDSKDKQIIQGDLLLSSDDDKKKLIKQAMRKKKPIKLMMMN